MLTVEERSRYQSDFGVCWLRLPVLVAGTLLAAVVVACFLELAFILGLYVILLMTFASGLSLGGVLYVLVDWTHCRNYWLAGSLGIVAGLIAFLGYYHLCLVDLLPPGNAWHIDLLPKYIWLRMHTDIVKKIGEHDIIHKPWPFFNCLGFVFNQLAIAGLAATFAWKRARRAYCEEVGQWIQQEIALLPPFSSADCRAAFDNGTLPQFVANTSAGNAPQTASRFILEYAAPKSGSPLEFPIYASFEDFPQPRPWYWSGKVRRTSVRQVELELAEVLALRPLFPKLSRLLETQHSELRDLPAEVPIPRPSLAPSDRAKITPVPKSYRQRVLGKGYNLAVNLFNIPPSAYLRRLRREIAQRPKLLVDPEDPASIFVSLIPRERFSDKGFKWMWASDLLFLKLDKSRRQLLMEGDLDRYRIPAGAISICEPECFFNPYDRQQTNPLWMVRLMVYVEQGRQELLLSVNHTRQGRVNKTRRPQVTKEMCGRIAKLCDQNMY